MAIGRNPARPAVHAELPALRGILTQTAARAAHLSSPVAWASVADLVAAKKQARQLKRAVCALTRRVNSLLAAIGEEEQRRSHQSTPTSSTLAPPPPPPPPVRCRDGGERGRYAGRVPFGLAQMGAAFVPTIHQVLADFPAGRSLGYCKIRVGDDARRGVDCARMAGYSVGDLEGHQSAAVGLEEWSGPAALAGMVCSIFTAPDAGDDEEIRRHGFVFPDMEAAEAAAPQLHGYELFCATVEGACAADKKPYLVIPSECTSEWRRSAGLPQEPCIDCGSRLRQTAGRIAGVHTPYEYISSAAQSGTGMHVEDAMLGSANIVLAGAPKVWLIVPPDNLDALEAKMEKLGDSLRPIQPCSQFVRHLDALLSPRLLEKWGIEYDIVTCRAGEMVVTLPGAYHQVLNAGPNYAQAINFAMPDCESEESNCSDDDDDDCDDDDDDHSSDNGPECANCAECASGISRWSDCVLHTARHRGFNAEAVLKAFHNAPEDQPIVKENSEDIGALVRIHQNISTLRTISWITQYELATHQLEYYQQFEAVVKTRKADTKKATDERRNLQTQVAVKEEIVAMMTKQGMSELAAKDELEQYLKHGTSDSNSSSLVPK
ncbi:putative transcription factor jumonji aspartyl beta-hydroxylase protein [Neofusicoccum parvum UCRNP2]|uniref:Putative transcription factor jumonji aspartyl beta-hydroxylase protein n=1 Tax=Botryosphaeria parva (strain UCR-NP2) TaxID=1287680 RepID=R1G7P2_BOTPV|nr:putative transcription factor jumonji aspartyl beta-hydroxylase protein [Neofusicoccum parvum UCRNP2]